MERMLSLGSVCVFTRKRKKDDGATINVYCYKVKDPLSGQYGNYYSIKSLAKKLGVEQNYPKMNLPDARAIVAMGVDRGIITEEVQGPEEILLIPYVEKVCTFDGSPWIAAEKARTGNEKSRRYLSRLLGAFQLYAKPRFPASKTLKSLTKKEVLILQESMAKDGVSADNINSAIAAMRTAYNFAESREVIMYNPFYGIKPYRVVTRVPEILSRAELRKVLVALEEMAKDLPKAESSYLAVKLAVCSGMREGEIRALKPRQLKRLINDDGEATPFYTVLVDSSWDQDLHSVGPTKGRYKRTTVIPDRLAKELLDHCKGNPQGSDGFVFWSMKGSTNVIAQAGLVPLTKNSLLEPFYEALAEIGIEEEERDRRRITFHTLRHYYDTAVKDEARRLEPLKQEIRAAVGHKSIRVDELIYTHDTTTSLIALGVMASHLLDDGKDAGNQ